MTPDWHSLPLLPLRCVLDHLSTEDALAAMSTCRQWRNAILLFEGQKDILKLRAKQMRKTLFLTRIFRKHSRRVHIYLDGNGEEIEKLINVVLPQYFDTVKLKELIFIGPRYSQLNQHVPLMKLKRILTESLVVKNLHCIETFGLLGCELNDADEDEKCIHKHVEFYSRGLLFSQHSIISPVNLRAHDITSTLRHVILDCSQINVAGLNALGALRQLRYLTLNVTNRRTAWPRLEWRHVQGMYVQPLQLIVNIIAVPYRRFKDVMNNILVEGLNLVSLKVMFCKSLYTPLVAHVARLYPSTLREMVWADSPYESNDPYHRIVRPLRQVQPGHMAHVNPFVLLCWQCTHLRRLVIHGYWTWHYDLLGFVRLRKTLTALEISAIYNKQGQFDTELQMSQEGAVRVLANDRPTTLDALRIDEVNEFTEFFWQPVQWPELHPGLRLRATPSDRSDYVLDETRRTLSVRY